MQRLPLKLGVLGTGRAAEFLHAPALLDLQKEIRVCAAYDTDPNRARAFCSRFPGARVASSVDELLESVDAVAILTPPASHGELAMQAIGAGRHVLIEKPLAATAADAIALARTAKDAGICAAAGHNLRFHRLVRRAADAVKTGRLGKLRRIEMRWSSPASNQPGWRDDPGQGGGVVFDLGVHHIDLARFITSAEFTNLDASGDPRRTRVEGVLADATQFDAIWSCGAHANHTVRLIGESASVEFSMYSAISWRPARLEDLIAAVRGRKSGGDSAASYRAQWLDFAEAIRLGRPPFCPLDEAAKSVGICESLVPRAAEPAPESDGPALSVVLAVHGSFDMVRRTVRHLAAQTVRDRIELVLAWASVAGIDIPANIAANFHSCTVEKVRPGSSAAAANAAGVRRASAPIVALAEDHCFPDPNWAEALIEAHARGYAAVGPEIANGNPATVVSWCDYLIGYGPWMSPAIAGEAPFLPGHNSSYKRAILLEYGDDLEDKLESETVLHYEMVRDGHRLYVEPRARASHLNFAQWRIWLPIQFHCGRVFAASRAADWGLGQKLFYAAASPLIPLVRLRRIAGELLRPNRPRHLLGRILPALTLGLLLDGAGQMLGYILGSGRSREYLAEYEHDRVRYIHPADRRALDEADARAVS